MTNHSMTPELFSQVLEMLPPRIRKNLFEDDTFLAQFALSTVTNITLGEDGPSFRRDSLYDSIRNALQTQHQTATVHDEKNNLWEVFVKQEGETLKFYCRSDDQSYTLKDHSGLADDVITRTDWFERVAKKVYLEDPIYQNWQSHLRERPLTDQEFTELLAEIEQSPVSTELSIKNNLAHSKVDLGILVPRNRNYYGKLVGHLGSAKTVAEYIEIGAKPLIAGLKGWSASDGFLYALFLCSIGLISESIDIDDLSSEALQEIYQWLINYGDPMSLTGAVEIALSHLDNHPELAPFIEQIVKKITAEDPESDENSFSLLSTMIVLIASELAETRLLEDVPPFYRRQAAIAQASMAVRASNLSHTSPKSMIEWAETSGLCHTYYPQALIDLRLEPRWLPDFVIATQLRAESIGRISNAARKNEAKIQSESLRALLLGPDSSLAGAAPWPLPSLPGPLEGGEHPQNPIPEHILKEVTEALEKTHLEADSFNGLVNTSLLFDLPEGQSNLAASALHRVKFLVEKVEDDDTTLNLIYGLAIVAAATRGSELADALRILIRVLRRRQNLSIRIDHELRTLMIAAAAIESLEDWARFAGEWITEIAFEIDEKNAAKSLLANIRKLVQLEPTLMPHCAAADAALTAFVH
ncbi:hypothetical protein ACQUQP_02265 [Marinobacterium sp. YM272]|uniref:hypothetical protein n=1 Tax=Marinobacterium sp. YM272 TaxID=3421654 RepID=UPI003D7FD6F1